MVIFTGMVIWEGLDVKKEATKTMGLCHTPAFLVTYGVNLISSIIFLVIAVKITQGVNMILKHERTDSIESSVKLEGTKEAMRKLWIIVGSVVVVNVYQISY